MEKTEIEMLAGVSNNGISIVYRFFNKSGIILIIVLTNIV